MFMYHWSYSCSANMIISHPAIEISYSLLFSLKRNEVDVGALTLVSSDAAITSRVVFVSVTSRL